MTRQPWADIVARTVSVPPLSTDRDRSAPSVRSGQPVPHRLPAPPSVLFPPKDSQKAFIGVRVRQPPGDPVALAIRLAAIAAERGVYPVILSEMGHTGLERFGLRVEHVASAEDDPDGNLLAEVEAFWNLAIIVDAEEIAGFG